MILRNSLKQSVTFVLILIQRNIPIYSSQENDTNEYPNIFHIFKENDANEYSNEYSYQEKDEYDTNLCIEKNYLNKTFL